jgi:hypothetical protein
LAKVLAFGPLWFLLQSTVPYAEIPVCHDDNGNDDDVRAMTLASRVGAWTVGRGCASGLLPFCHVPPLPLPATTTKASVSSPDDSTVEREVPLAGCNLGGTVSATAAVSVAGGIAFRCAISRHHPSNLKRNRALRPSRGSRGPGPPSPFGPFPTAISSLPARSEQQRRRDADRECGAGDGGGPMITPVGASGAFPFAPLVVVVPSACLIPFVHRSDGRSTVSWRRPTSLSRERTLSRRYAPPSCSCPLFGPPSLSVVSVFTESSIRMSSTPRPPLWIQRR